MGGARRRSDRAGATDRAGGAAGDEGSLAYVYVLLAQAECLLGDFDHGRRNAEAAREIAEQAGQQALVGYGSPCRPGGRPQRPRARGTGGGCAALEIGRSTEFMPVSQFAGAALGLLELSLGHPAEAAEQLAPLVELARTERIASPASPATSPTGRGARRARPARRGRELLGWYEGNAERLGRRGATPRHAGAAACSPPPGRARRSARPLREALANTTRSRCPFDRARTLLLYGAALRRSKRKADARDRLEQAAPPSTNCPPRRSPRAPVPSSHASADAAAPRVASPPPSARSPSLSLMGARTRRSLPPSSSR